MNMFRKLPYFVILQGRKFKINVDFRNMISYEKIVQNKNISKEERIEKIIKNFYPFFSYNENFINLCMNPSLYKEACKKIIWFYKCGRKNYHKLSGHGNNVSSQIYSFDYDDEYIYGAFLEQYGIDLSTDKVHWWKFKALLKSLKDDTEFVKIKGYRAYEGKDENIQQLKKYWSLPLPKTEQERLDKLYETLK